jgi:hypothetical protein
LLRIGENDHSVRAQVGCSHVQRVNQSGCFPAKARGKEFLEPITSVAFVP